MNLETRVRATGFVLIFSGAFSAGAGGYFVGAVLVGLGIYLVNSKSESREE